MTKKTKIISSLCLLLLCMYSCKKEETQFNEKVYPKTESAFSITFSTDVHAESRTYAMTDDDENHANTIDIIAFHEKNGSYYYSYQRQAKNLVQKGNTVDFKIDLLQLQEKQIFAVIINGRKALAQARLQPETPIDDVANALIIQSPDEWDANNNNYIPMFGYSAATQITTTPPSISLEAKRMLARIDLKIDAAIQSKFVLTTAYLFNRKTAGFLGFTLAQNSGKFFALVPPAASTVKLNSTVYYASSSLHQLDHTIYTFEATKPTDKKQATAIIVGGRYNGAPESFYRIDIPEYNSNGAQIPNSMGEILRNHLYSINITNVTHSGASTPVEAFDGGVYLTAEVKDWTLENQDVAFNGQHTLSVGVSHFNFPNNGLTTKITVKTDGQLFTAISPVPWLKVSWLNSMSEIEITALPNGSRPRDSDVTITSNNMSYVLKIHQD